MFIELVHRLARCVWQKWVVHLLHASLKDPMRPGWWNIHVRVAGVFTLVRTFGFWLSPATGTSHDWRVFSCHLVLGSLCGDLFFCASIDHTTDSLHLHSHRAPSWTQQEVRFGLNCFIFYCFSHQVYLDSSLQLSYFDSLQPEVTILKYDPRWQRVQGQWLSANKICCKSNTRYIQVCCLNMVFSLFPFISKVKGVFVVTVQRWILLWTNRKWDWSDFGVFVVKYLPFLHLFSLTHSLTTPSNFTVYLIININSIIVIIYCM